MADDARRHRAITGMVSHRANAPACPRPIRSSAQGWTANWRGARRRTECGTPIQHVRRPPSPCGQASTCLVARPSVAEAQVSRLVMRSWADSSTCLVTFEARRVEQTARRFRGCAWPPTEVANVASRCRRRGVADMAGDVGQIEPLLGVQHRDRRGSPGVGAETRWVNSGRCRRCGNRLGDGLAQD